MNRIGFKVIVVGLIAVASVATPWLIQRQAHIRWCQRADLLRRQAGQIRELSAENERLANLAAPTGSSALSREQMSELMKLRAEVGQLRKSASEAARFGVNQPTPLDASRNPERTSAPPDPATVQAYWPKAKLAFAGYAVPLSALQTTLCAVTRNDPDALAGSVTPGAKSELVKRAPMNDGSPADRIALQAKLLSDSLGTASGFYVLQLDVAPLIQPTNPDTQILTVYFEGEGTTRAFGLRKTGNEWRLEGIYAMGGTDAEPRLGPPLWP